MNLPHHQLAMQSITMKPLAPLAVRLSFPPSSRKRQFRCALFVLLKLVPFVLPEIALAASYNIDIGGGPLPSVSYGGAAGQTGFWNDADSGPSLTDIAGNSTSVTLVFPDAPWPDTHDHPGTVGDDQALLDDFLTWPPSTSMPFMIVGLPTGTYQFFSYSFAPNAANSSVDIAGSPEGFQLLGGTWPGSHQLGVTYALHTVTLSQPGDVTVNIGVWNGQWGGFNGLQIVQIPESSAAILLLPSILLLALRRHRQIRAKSVPKPCALR